MSTRRAPKTGPRRVAISRKDSPGADASCKPGASLEDLQRAKIGRGARSRINRIRSRIEVMISGLDDLQRAGLLRRSEADDARAALRHMLDVAAGRNIVTDGRARAEAERKQLARRVLAAIAKLPDCVSITVEDVLVQLLKWPRQAVTHLALAEVGRILTAAGWRQSRPRGTSAHGPVRRRVYHGPQMSLFDPQVRR